MSVAVYCRVSSEEQRERQTIATQVDYAKRYCDLRELAITGFYLDDGVSGLIPIANRPEGKRLLDDAKAKKFDTVLVYKIDRLGRNALLILNSVEDIKSLGVQVGSMTEQFDTSTPSGRFMLTMLAAVAAMERDNFLERSANGTNLRAREGAWLGGIVPYGYRVEGESRTARLVISEEPLPGLVMSEADVIRLVYRKISEEKQSCVVVADLLNQLGIPPSYTKDSRTILRGKRQEVTSGIWRPSRVRNLVVNTTYKGLHQYGKRSKKQREVIERSVPAIVSVETWEKAQQTLKGNMLFSSRNAKRKYLLRGLIKCGLCGLTYIGTAYPVSKKPPQAYYTCNGKHGARGIYGIQGQRCPSKAINAKIEEIIWQDIEEMLRNPGDVLHQLSERMQEQAGKTEQVHEDVTQLHQTFLSKEKERDLVIGLYRKGRIDGSALDTQLDQIEREEADLKKRLVEASRQATSTQTVTTQLHSAESLLTELNQALDQPLEWEVKREIIETLVESIRVDTIGEGKKKQAVVNVSYYFRAQSGTANYRGTDSWQQSK